MIEQLKRRAKQLKIEIYTLYLAYRDSRVSWPAKLFAAIVVAYALSPIDLIPDFIPVFGYLDDLILIPIGITIVLKMIPEPVLNDCREEARQLLSKPLKRNWTAAGFIISIWILLLVILVSYIRKFISL